MNKNIYLLIFAILLYWAIIFLTRNIQLSVSPSSLIVFYTSALVRELPLLIGCFIGLFGKKNSWKYSLLFGVMVFLSSLIFNPLFELRNTEYSIQIYYFIDTLVLAVLGGLAGEKIREIRSRKSK